MNRGVYVHIPFCRTLCPYCDFVRVPLEGAVPESYIDALLRELAAYDGPHHSQSIYLGGGTPSLLDPPQLERIFAAVHETFHMESPEITLEANPDDVTRDLARAWHDLGINRVSLGVQSFDDRVLRYLGRRHDAHASRCACEHVAGRFANWTLDLIFGAHPADAWAASLAEALRFAPPHISAYGLTYEPGTPFGDRTADALGDDAMLALYREAHATLCPPYTRYEISNFARPGREARHNLLYWRNEEYAGFGAGAYAFIDGLRSRNQPDVAAYIQAPLAKTERLKLSVSDQMIETAIQHFRLAPGLPKAYFLERFHHSPDNVFGDALASLQDRELIEETTAAWRPTVKGFELNNEIGLALVAP